MKNLLLLLFSLIFFAGCANSTDNGYDDSADLEFLEEYRLEEGVIETDSGLLYKILEEGEGPKPRPESIVLLDMVGEHVSSGQIVNNTYENDFSAFLHVESLLPGYNEAFQLMNIGSTYEFVFPSELTNEEGRVFQYEIEVHNTQENFISEYAQQEDVITTESGLMYRVIEEGDGEKPDGQSTVSINYKGTLINSQEFDSGQGWEPEDINSLIDGFTEGLLLMNTGSTYEFLIPPELAYGNQTRGNIIYSNAALQFEIELLEVQ